MIITRRLTKSDPTEESTEQEEDCSCRFDEV